MAGTLGGQRHVIIGMAVTRDGIPVRVLCWPGNTSDSALIRQVKDDMRDWCLSKVIWVADRGFTSAAIIGEKLRSGSAEAAAALSRQGRYKDVAGNLKVKEVRIAEDERFVICFNPEAAERDAAVRARMIAQLEQAITGSDQLSRDKRAALRGVISTKPGLNRYLRVTPAGYCAPTPRRRKPRRTSTASTYSGRQPRNCQQKTSPSGTSNCSKSSADGET